MLDITNNTKGGRVMFKAKNPVAKNRFLGNIIARAKSIAAKHKGKVVLGGTMLLLLITQACKKPCDKQAYTDTKTGIRYEVRGDDKDCYYEAVDKEPCNEPWNPDCPNYDPCWQVRHDYDSLSNIYFNKRDSALTYWLPKCFAEIDGYRDAYNQTLPRDDSLKTMVTLRDENSGYHPMLNTSGDCAERALKAAKDRQEFFDLNSICFMK
jgi:hypothetical protein